MSDYEPAIAEPEAANAFLNEMVDQAMGAEFPTAPDTIREDHDMLLGEIGRLESRISNEINLLRSEIESRTSKEIDVLRGEIEGVRLALAATEARAEESEACRASEEELRDVYRQAWQSAPLDLRLRFVRELLPTDHAYQAPLKEIAGLEELRRRGGDLDEWIRRYPSLFADAIASVTGSIQDATNPAERLAHEALEQARHAVEVHVEATGLRWIAPVDGAPITEEHQIVGDEASTSAPGRIARVRRPGIRLAGRLLLPAQVLRTTQQTAPQPAAANSIEPNISREPVSETDVSAEDVNHGDRGSDSVASELDVPSPLHEPASAPAEIGPPDWLRTIQQRALRCTVPAVNALVERLVHLMELTVEANAGTLSSERLWDAVSPLQAVLTARHPAALEGMSGEWGGLFIEIQPDLLRWLQAELSLSLVAPAVGDPFDPALMESVGIRSTVHAHEDGAVAKLEAAGLAFHGDPLLRAQVRRYDSGGER